MAKDNFVKNSFLLTSSNITTGLLGFIFSIYLSKLLGPEGMGLYGLIMPVYNLFICLMTAGIIAAISQISAIYSARREFNNLTKTLSSVAFFNVIWSIFIGVLVFICASSISKYGINDIRTADAIRVTCPAMVFIALSNILKGYFLGMSKIAMPAIIDILEKALRIVTIALLIFLFKATSMTTLVTLAYVSLAIGELQSLLLLYIYYRRVKTQVPVSYEKPERKPQLLFNVLIISLPLCLNGFIGNIFATLSTLIVPRRLLAAGFQYEAALGLIGKFSGMALTIVTFPLIVVASINSLLVPDLSQSLSRGEYYNASVRIRKVLKISFLLGIATTVICNLIPDSLGEMFYGRGDLALYIRVASLSAPIFFPANTMFGILNGLNKQSVILKNSIIISIVELICLFIFTSIPSINILGYGITMFITSAISLVINFREIKKHIDISLSGTNIIIFLLLSIFIFILSNLLIKLMLQDLFIVKNLIVIVIIFMLFGVLSFFGLDED